MTGNLSAADGCIVVHRLAGSFDISQYLKSKPTLSDKQIVQLLGVLGRKFQDRVLDAPFERKIDGKFGFSSRFSTGEWPTFYSAAEIATAEAEAGYHYARKAANAPGSLSPVYYYRMACKFVGSLADLTHPNPSDPRLTQADYTHCQSLGKQAASSGLGAYLTPSARNPAGVNAPIFRRETLSDITYNGIAKFTYDNGGSFTVTMI